MNVDCFYYTETNRREWAAHVALGAKVVRFEVADDATLADIMTAAPRGSSRSGTFEIQTDAGIWSRRDERQFGRLNESNAIFTKWD